MRTAFVSALFCGLGVLVAAPAVARQVVPPSYGHDFITITHPGNAPYTGGSNGHVEGRGSVGYEYRISRMEVTTGQWLAFVNTFSMQDDAHGFFAVPSAWGAGLDPNYDGPGNRWILGSRPDAATLPVFGITWRDAAMYCNWLCNGQSSDFSAIASGAYDTSTFTRNPDGTFNDQRYHTPGAAYWIPTLDEWLKASHWDPNADGPGQAGWWQYSNTSDTAPISGLPPPGPGETSAGVNLPQFGWYNIPLGAYPDTLTPWGLLDASGGGREWIEETYEDRLFGGRRWRGAQGSFAGPASGPDDDDINSPGIDFPLGHGSNTLRIVSAVPSPSTFGILLLTLGHVARRRRPHHVDCTFDHHIGWRSLVYASRDCADGYQR